MSDPSTKSAGTMGCIGRFAPSTTGPAHPGTLLAALLCWLDARSRGGRVLLRLEDLDPERCRPTHATAMIADLAWLGLDWDAVGFQHDLHGQHAAALDRLAALGRLYPSPTSRAELERLGRRAPDGGWAYDNRDRGRILVGGWRDCTEPLRCRIDDGVIALRDESGDDLTQDPVLAFGDPVVRRRDGAVSYQLAVVVDDGAAGVDRVVRGRDIATSTATQVALQRLLGAGQPAYHHHLLLLEERGRKLAKLHGSVAVAQLRERYSAEELVGVLGWLAGLLPVAEACRAQELVRGFDWESVRREDRVARWTGAGLEG